MREWLNLSFFVLLKDSTATPLITYQGSRDTLPSVKSETSLNGDVVPYRSQPRCDHLLPSDPAVQMAEGMLPSNQVKRTPPDSINEPLFKH